MIPGSEDYRMRPSKNNEWTDRELSDLSTALQKHGFHEYKKIAEVVKTKSATDVRAYLCSEIAKVRASQANMKQRKRQCTGDLAPEEDKELPGVRKWLKIAQNQMTSTNKYLDYSRMAMKNICQAFYDEAEDSKSPEEVDVKAIYKYMLDCVSGNIPATLRPIESALVLMLFKQMKEMIHDLDLEKEKDFIRNFRRATLFYPYQLVQEDTRPDPAQRIPGSVPVAEEMYMVLHRHRRVVQSFNPLQVYMWLLEEEQKYLYQMFGDD